MERLRRVGWVAVLIADAGLLAWGAMAALAPEHLPGPGLAPILAAGYEGFTKRSWSDLADTSPATIAFMTVLFRVYGAYIVAFGLLAIAVSATALRRGEPWAWWALLVGNTIAYGAAMTYDLTVGAIGPFEMSEPENRNLDWLAARPNMKFAMNLHSSGNYFMWSPGAYSLPGRVSAPRPTLEQESFFWGASQRILTAIKAHRGMSVTPAQTGPISDVLYSAAGNSGDMLWYKYGIYAWNFEVGTSFQPPFWLPIGNALYQFHPSQITWPSPYWNPATVELPLGFS